MTTTIGTIPLTGSELQELLTQKAAEVASRPEHAGADGFGSFMTGVDGRPAAEIDRINGQGGDA